MHAPSPAGRLNRHRPSLRRPRGLLDNPSMAQSDGMSPSVAQSDGGMSPNVAQSEAAVGGVAQSARAQTCKYKSGKCANPRATKRNGQLHTLCAFHRLRQNEHQRKSDRKHRLLNVTRRAKLNSIGYGARNPDGECNPDGPCTPGGLGNPGGVPGTALSLRSILSLNAEAQAQQRPAELAAQFPSAQMPLGGPRLPPISYLTGKLDGARASSAVPALTRPAPW